MINCYSCPAACTPQTARILLCCIAWTLALVLIGAVAALASHLFSMYNPDGGPYGT